MREGRIMRRTREVDIEVSVVIDGSATFKGSSGLKFLDHLLELISYHGCFDIEVRSTWDLKHHGIEELAVSLGKAFGQALGERQGIRRFGFALVAMDESLSEVSIDLVYRSFAVVNLSLTSPIIEDVASEDLTHFFESFATNVPCTLHMNVRYGRNDHHKVESATKAFALAMREASSIDPRRTGPPSSKGVI